VLAQAAPPFVGPAVQWYSLAPLITLVGGGLVLMVLSALLPGRWPRGGYAIFTAVVAGTAATFTILLWHDVQDTGPKSLVGGAIGLDGFSLFLTFVICVAVFISALFLDDYLRRIELDGAEVYALMLMSASGGMIMASANDLIVLFLGFEALSLALYVMAASQLRRIESQESGIKYFILGGFSSAFLLYGIALVYGATGSTNLTKIVDFLDKNVLFENGLLLAGIALLLVGLAFKVAAVPFHTWTPDVYQGAPTPVTGFMASAAKAAAFAALIRVVVVGLAPYESDWQPVIWVLAVITVLGGAILAVVQTNVKRMLAYSSISHAGFILVGVDAAGRLGGNGDNRGTAAVLFYLLAYAVMVLGTFGVVTLVSRAHDGDQSLEAFRGLSRNRPVLALALTIFLLAQAGVPLTTGFVAKFGVIAAAVDARSYVLAVIAMLASVIAAFLYLRIIVSMYLADPLGDEEQQPEVRVPFSAGLGLVLTLGFTVVVGFLPWWLVDYARDAVPHLVAASGP
jgi:NADH-quinone oxidoreductase subunit N